MVLKILLFLFFIYFYFIFLLFFLFFIFIFFVVVQYSGFDKPSEVVECDCGYRFCFACNLENHNPITCQQYTKWKEKIMDEGASLKLLHTIAKQCPHCGLPTERNQGNFYLLFICYFIF